MTFNDINWQPTDRQLRQFGVACLIALPLIAWLWGGTSRTVAISSGIGVAIAIVGLTLPRVLKEIFVAFSLVTAPIGMVVSEVAMFILFFGVFLPIGLIFRLVHRDAMQRNFDSNVASYWTKKRKPDDVASYYRQS